MDHQRLWADFIRSSRTALQLTQEGLAELLGVNSTTISRWERGAEKPRSRRREKEIRRRIAEEKNDRE